MKRATKMRESSEARRAELIVATLKSLRKHGYVNSTINTISEESGLSRGLISHYFANKDDLLIVAHKYYLQNVDDFFRHVVWSTKSGHFGKLFYSVSVPFLRDTGFEQMLVHYFSAAWMLPEVLRMHRDLWGRYRTNIRHRISAAARERGGEYPRQCRRFRQPHFGHRPGRGCAGRIEPYRRRPRPEPPRGDHHHPDKLTIGG